MVEEKEEKREAGDKVILEDLKGGEEKEKTSKTLLANVDVSALDTLMGKMEEFCDKRTLIEQDKIAYTRMKGEGKDPKDSFRVTGISEKGDGSAELDIITSGEKGEESAKETLSSLKRYEHVSVKSETSERYEKESPESREEFGKWMERMLEDTAIRHRWQGDVKEAERLEAGVREMREMKEKEPEKYRRLVNGEV